MATRKRQRLVMPGPKPTWAVIQPDPDQKAWVVVETFRREDAARKSCQPKVGERVIRAGVEQGEWLRREGDRWLRIRIVWGEHDIPEAPEPKRKDRALYNALKEPTEAQAKRRKMN